MMLKLFKMKNKWLSVKEIDKMVVKNSRGRLVKKDYDRRARAMNQLFYGLRKDGMKYTEIGEMMGVSPQRAKQRVSAYEVLIEKGVVRG